METKELSKFVAETTYEALDLKTIGLAKMCVLDFMGAALAGSREESSRLLREVVLSDTGEGEAVVLDGSFRRVSPAAAAATPRILTTCTTVPSSIPGLLPFPPPWPWGSSSIWEDLRYCWRWC